MRCLTPLRFVRHDDNHCELCIMHCELRIKHYALILIPNYLEFLRLPLHFHFKKIHARFVRAHLDLGFRTVCCAFRHQCRRIVVQSVGHSAKIAVNFQIQHVARWVRVCRKLNFGDFNARLDRKSTRLNSSHIATSRMPSSA